jgi:two-component system OmpR family sensor kinase
MFRSLARWSLRSRLVLGVVILSTLGFLASGIAVENALKNFLIQQVDDQLISIASGSLPRIDRAGIVDNRERHQQRLQALSDSDDYKVPSTPLDRIPTSVSITLLGPTGKILGVVGGDLNTVPIASLVEGYTPKTVSQVNGKPFTLQNDDENFRILAQELPSIAGSILIAQSLNEVNKTLNQVGWLLLLIGLIAISLIALASRAVIKVGLAPLTDVENTAEKIASGDLSARLPDAKPTTEVGRLVTSLNSMLARIENSFSQQKDSEDKLRRFVADASHELRTPLTAIRGFAELHRQGAVADGEDTKILLSRIEGESMRMGSLVEDLLLLARVDQSREMESKPFDLSRVVEDAVISARVAGPQHPITFTQNENEIYTLGDELRIHQVVANLLANARTHTPDGTDITVSILDSSDGTRITVADRGPGLSEQDQSKIFERFYRADVSRTRADGEGSGLGLSIVDAVMKAHGGTITVDSELGVGATFTLFFPHPNE